MSNTFARRFTAFAALIVIAIVAVTLSWRTLRSHLATVEIEKVTRVLRIHLEQNEFLFGDITVTGAKQGGSQFTVGFDRTVYYRVTNLKHPIQGRAETAVISAVLVDRTANGKYLLEDFSILQPDYMRVERWYYQ